MFHCLIDRYHQMFVVDDEHLIWDTCQHCLIKFIRWSSSVLSNNIAFLKLNDEIWILWIFNIIMIGLVLNDGDFLCKFRLDIAYLFRANQWWCWWIVIWLCWLWTRMKLIFVFFGLFSGPHLWCKLSICL